MSLSAGTLAILLELLQCKYDFLRLQYSGSESFFLLVYTNLSNSCYYLFPPQPEDNRDFYIYPQDILHSFQEVMVRNFPSATILFVSPLQGSRVSVLYHKKMCISKQSPWAIFILTIKVKSHA